MYSREVLMDWVLEALDQLGGRGSVVQVSRQVWENHEQDLRTSGDLFYTWQYDVRWAATKLRRFGKIRPVHGETGRPWELTGR